MSFMKTKPTPDNSKSNEESNLEEELTEMLQAITPDTQDPDVLEFYKSTFLELFQQTALEARLEEVSGFNTHRHYGKDYQESMDELAEYKEARITDLQKQLEGGSK